MSVVIPLFAVTVLSILVGVFGLSKISEGRSSLAKVQKDQVFLTQKLDILRTVASYATESTDGVLGALPNSNPSIAVISQIKSLAQENSVLISGIKSGPEILEKSGLSRVDVTFDISAPREKSVVFLRAIETVAPIMIVDKIRLREESDLEKSTIIVKAFWSPLPSKLPSITTQINDLTAAEKQVTVEIGNLRKPNLVQVTPSQEVGRADPFSP